MHLIAPLDKRFSLLYILLQEHIVNDVDYKAIVFCTTTAVTRLVAEFLCKLNMNVGAPSNRAQYIHRLGGTGHDGKKAQGMLLLAPWEGFFLSSIKDLAIAEAPLPLVDPDINRKIRLNSRIKKVGEDKHRLVELANDLSRSIGLYNLPEIPTRILNEMGLMNSPDVRATLDHNWIFLKKQPIRTMSTRQEEGDAKVGRGGEQAAIPIQLIQAVHRYAINSIARPVKAVQQ
ncbi:hypothetical protein Gorai_021310 [Gossypium raimondii]|uniref:Helicase C-terminal domain-containing protein n=1 Tax=Gossypium raimondii TaxID=29730 RepID=A0A7J8NQ84_GOSRA|nr:hypothetical protein [Gossypium raimondii]